MVTPPTWAGWREALGVIAYRPHLRKTVRITLVVDSVLFCINQLDVVMRGNASTATWVKGAITYVVPFVVSNLGVLVASRRRVGVRPGLSQRRRPMPQLLVPRASALR